jgi:hypothetical protein
LLTLTMPPWKRPTARLEGLSLEVHSSSMTPDEMQALLQAHNVGFSSKDIPHGRQFRLSDGAIANVYASGKIVWQGKDTPTALKVRGLYGAAEPAAPTIVAAPNEIISPSNNSLYRLRA